MYWLVSFLPYVLDFELFISGNRRGKQATHAKGLVDIIC